MRVGRTILALLVAFAVAALPMAGVSASVAKSAAILVSSSVHDCDHGGPGEDASKAAGDCAGMAACAAKCFNYAGTVVSDLRLLPVASTVPPVLERNLIVSQVATPPFRPPRV